MLSQSVSLSAQTRSLIVSRHDRTIRHMPFSIGVPLEQSLYLQPFSRYSAPKPVCIDTPQVIHILCQVQCIALDRQLAVDRATVIYYWFIETHTQSRSVFRKTISRQKRQKMNKYAGSIYQRLTRCGIKPRPTGQVQRSQRRAYDNLINRLSVIRCVKWGDRWHDLTCCVLSPS